MNKLCLAIVLLGFLIFSGSCKKTKVASSDGTTTIQVINAVIGPSALQVNTNNSPITYSSSDQIYFGSSEFYYVQRSVSTPFTVVSADDTASYLVNAKIDLTGSIYTMYIFGQGPNIDTMIRQETNYPFVALDQSVSSADSVINVRFVNLSPDSQPISVDIQGAATNEVSGLAYKGITDFKAYSAAGGNSSYTFEIKDAATNTVLTTHTFYIYSGNIFKNMALIVAGLEGNGSLSASEIDYFQN